MDGDLSFEGYFLGCRTKACWLNHLNDQGFVVPAEFMRCTYQVVGSNYAERGVFSFASF